MWVFLVLSLTSNEIVMEERNFYSEEACWQRAQHWVGLNNNYRRLCILDLRVPSQQRRGEPNYGT